MTQIFVGNLSYSTTASDLRAAFERYGRVADVRLATEKGTERPRGFAFVQMNSIDDADEAINKMAGVTLQGRRLTVNEAQDSRSDDPLMPKQMTTEQQKLIDIFDAL
ncbi:MAG: RNA-binding protein [Fuerstiella sp.]